jgi:hypothetical protein
LTGLLSSRIDGGTFHDQVFAIFEVLSSPGQNFEPHTGTNCTHVRSAHEDFGVQKLDTSISIFFNGRDQASLIEAIASISSISLIEAESVWSKRTK